MSKSNWLPILTDSWYRVWRIYRRFLQCQCMNVVFHIAEYDSEIELENLGFLKDKR